MYTYSWVSNKRNALISVTPYKFFKIIKRNAKKCTLISVMKIIGKLLLILLSGKYYTRKRPCHKNVTDVRQILKNFIEIWKFQNIFCEISQKS